jgi:hypothetical protein
MGSMTHWIIIFQEFDLEFVTSKRKKALTLVEFIYDLPTGASNPPLNDNIPDESFFAFSIVDPWYGDTLTFEPKNLVLI